MSEKRKKDMAPVAAGRPGRMKGQNIASLIPAALSMVVLVIVVAIGAQVLGEIRDTQNATTTEFNVTGEGLSSLTTFSDFFAVIVIIVVAVVVIGLLVSAFRVGRT